MPEIHLPTKAIQDSIKQDTTNILSHFPISGGSKWYTKLFNTIDPAVQQPNTILEIYGKGVLTLLKGGGALSNYSIQCDGGPLLGISLAANIPCPIAITFNTHVKVTCSLGANNGAFVSYFLE